MKQILLTTLFLLVLQYGNAQVVDQDVPRNARDQVISDDLIVLGSECVGLDCSNGESFGFSTIILKENNVRLKFFDTSNSASFPTNDWTIEANETSNGGRSYLGIRDDNTGRLPFSVAAGAPNNSLFVSSAGRLGIRTGSPVTDIHVVNGNTPTLRLEQDGTQGFTPQTWDLAGNETNFFIRDVTGGSKLPFKIRPGAPDNSLYVAANGNVGIGTTSPDAALNVKRSNASAAIKVEELSGTVAGRVLMNLINNGPTRIEMTNSSASSSWRNQVDNSGNYAIGLTGAASPHVELNGGTGAMTVLGDVTASGMLLTSDLRLKRNVSQFEGGLAEVLQIKPISYQFNEKSPFFSDRMFLGYGAQDLEEIAPYLTQDFSFQMFEEDGSSRSSDSYLKIDPMGIQVLLVNSIKEQQVQIEDKEERIMELEKIVDAIQLANEELYNKVENLMELISIDRVNGIILKGSSTARLGQNHPNPFAGNTSFEYFVPSGKGSAQIHFYDLNGKLIKTFHIAGAGKGQIDLSAEELPAGSYTYSLILEGVVVESRKMVMGK